MDSLWALCLQAYSMKRSNENGFRQDISCADS